jgi:hypothetical protein
MNQAQNEKIFSVRKFIIGEREEKPKDDSVAPRIMNGIHLHAFSTSLHNKLPICGQEADPHEKSVRGTNENLQHLTAKPAL